MGTMAASGKPSLKHSQPRHFRDQISGLRNIPAIFLTYWYPGSDQVPERSSRKQYLAVLKGSMAQFRRYSQRGQAFLSSHRHEKSGHSLTNTSPDVLVIPTPSRRARIVSTPKPDQAHAIPPIEPGLSTDVPKEHYLDNRRSGAYNAAGGSLKTTKLILPEH